MCLKVRQRMLMELDAEYFGLRPPKPTDLAGLL